MTMFNATEGASFEFLGRTLIVGPKCDDKTVTGNWVCTTHGEAYPNAMQLSSHCDSGGHEVAWNCHAHGPEVP